MGSKARGGTGALVGSEGGRSSFTPGCASAATCVILSSRSVAGCEGAEDTSDLRTEDAPECLAARVAQTAPATKKPVSKYIRARMSERNAAEGLDRSSKKKSPRFMACFQIAAARRRGGAMGRF
jgi:hypothetical protein